eukprot:NODE_3780_length_406_cov_73.532213_g3343_i0.p2 GENE.NODE_3780_length_406_cov_73.532213_g3343_i0~~NODE_3780_length_406_cov_73.532213_g3343_i0.p2  ORF type:complete len:61 (+),score=6.60 NODE_3780_length_406_cov_73.532213_g3343_i0:220-402(+)
MNVTRRIVKVNRAMAIRMSGTAYSGTCISGVQGRDKILGGEGDQADLMAEPGPGIPCTLR